MARIGMLAVAMLIAVPNASSAQATPPVCTAPGTLPPDLSAWSMLSFHDAAVSPATLSAARLTLGEAARITLLQTPAVTYVLRPEKPGAPDSFGGLLQVVVSAPGTYRVVLGSRAWIDLVAPGGKAVQSVAHTMGPPCTGIRKMVDFALENGNYTLQLSGNAEPASTVLVIRLP